MQFLKLAQPLLKFSKKSTAFHRPIRFLCHRACNISSACRNCRC